MLAFFRRFTQSRIGLVIVFIVLGLIALSFTSGNPLSSGGSGLFGSKANVVAKVGNAEITDADLRQRIEEAMQNLRQRGQPVSMQEFIARGYVEQALDETIDSIALQQFGEQSGMHVSKALIDGDIASNPNFQGVDGKFDQKTFDALLSQNRMSPKMLRDNLTLDRYGQWLLGRAVQGDAPAPKTLVMPYASGALQRRIGSTALISVKGMPPVADPDDKTLIAFYIAHKAAYTIPERRVIRYAMVTPDRYKAQATATDAEIAAAYKASGPRFQASEKRTISQVVFLDQAAATAAAAQARGGKSLADVAKAAGLAPSNYTAIDKSALATQASPALADAAFAAAQGGVVGPVKSPNGWNVLHIDKVEKVAAKSLDQARADLAGEITNRNESNKLAGARQAIEDATGEGKTFDDLVKANQLTAAATPALIANGLNPDDPNAKPDPATAAIVKAGFTMQSPEDDPQLVPVSADGSFAVVALQRIVPATPRPIADIRKQVVADYLSDTALTKVRAAATAAIAQINKGVPVDKALAAAGIKGVKVTPFDLKRAELIGKKVGPEIQMAFTMAPKKAKFVEAPDRSGFFIVYLDAIQLQDPAGDPKTTGEIASQLGPQLLPEQRAQFLEAIKRSVTVTRNAAAIARVKASLAGGSDSGS